MESHGLFLSIINSYFIGLVALIWMFPVFNVIIFTFLHETTMLHCNSEGLIIT